MTEIENAKQLLILMNNNDIFSYIITNRLQIKTMNIDLSSNKLDHRKELKMEIWLTSEPVSIQTKNQRTPNSSLEDLNPISSAFLLQYFSKSPEIKPHTHR